MKLFLLFAIFAVFSTLDATNSDLKTVRLVKNGLRCVKSLMESSARCKEWCTKDCSALHSVLPCIKKCRASSRRLSLSRSDRRSPLASLICESACLSKPGVKNLCHNLTGNKLNSCLHVEACKCIDCVHDSDLCSTESQGEDCNEAYQHAHVVSEEAGHGHEHNH